MAPEISGLRVPDGAKPDLHEDGLYGDCGRDQRGGEEKVDGHRTSSLCGSISILRDDLGFVPPTRQPAQRHVFRGACRTLPSAFGIHSTGLSMRPTQQPPHKFPRFARLKQHSRHPGLDRQARRPIDDVDKPKAARHNHVPHSDRRS
jgi:hypothetical protein